MGFKAIKAVALALGISLIPAVFVNAESVDCLYSFYDMDKHVTIPDEVQQVLSSYQDAERYVNMYHYVIISDFDRSLLESQLESVTSDLERTELKLRNGYSLTLSEIYELEDTYTQLMKRRNELENSLSRQDSDYDIPNPGQVPTHAQYVAASEKKDKIIKESDIGDFEERKIPIEGAALLRYNDSDYTSMSVADKSRVKPMFNGTVEDIYEDVDFGLTIKISHSNGAYSYVCNLESVAVVVGENVTQKTVVGQLVDNIAVYRLELDGEMVDVSELYF